MDIDIVSERESSPRAQRERRAVGFVCNWNGYSGAEMAGAEGLEYGASLRLVRLACLGRLRLGTLLRAFELGADGVLLLGCPPEECHYGHGSGRASELAEEAKKVLSLLGADPARVEFVEVPLGGGQVFAARVKAFMDHIENSEPAALSGTRPTAEIIKEASSC